MTSYRCLNEMFDSGENFEFIKFEFIDFPFTLSLPRELSFVFLELLSQHFASLLLLSSEKFTFFKQAIIDRSIHLEHYKVH
jgi:hypothetical protein